MRLGGVNLFGHAMFGALLNTVRPMSRIKYVVAATQHPGDVIAGRVDAGVRHCLLYTTLTHYTFWNHIFTFTKYQTQPNKLARPDTGQTHGLCDFGYLDILMLGYLDIFISNP